MNPWEQPPPAPAAERRIEIVRVPAGATWRVVCTGNRVAALRTHHSDGRTLPCLTPWDQECFACKRGLSWRREGYLSVHILSRRVSAVLALPDKALEQLERLHPDRLAAANLQYTGLELQRRGESRRAPLLVTWFGDSIDLPDRGIDVPLVLCRAWGMPALLEQWRSRLRAAAAVG